MSWATSRWERKQAEKQGRVYWTAAPASRPTVHRHKCRSKDCQTSWSCDYTKRGIGCWKKCKKCRARDEERESGVQGTLTFDTHYSYLYFDSVESGMAKWLTEMVHDTVTATMNVTMTEAVTVGQYADWGSFLKIPAEESV